MRRWRLLLSFFVSAVLICIVGTQAYAQTRASDYVARYSVSAHQGENRGQIDIDCNIRAKWAVPKEYKYLGHIYVQVQENTLCMSPFMA